MALYLYSALVVFVASRFIWADGASAVQVFAAMAFIGGWVAVCVLYSRRHKATFYAMFLAFSPIAIMVLLKWYARIQFVIEHGGMDCPGCNGSPLAFLIGVIFEAIVFVPGLIGLIIVYKRKSVEDADAG